MNCCVDCFNDHVLKNYIDRRGIVSDCYYCNTKNIKCIEQIELYEFFSKIFNLYSRENDYFDDFFSLKENMSKPNTLLNLLQKDWDIFNASKLSLQMNAELIANISPKNKKLWIFTIEVTSPIWFRDREKYFGYFSNNNWDVFCETIKHEYRFFNGSSNKIEFNIERTFGYVEKIFDKPLTLFRGRIGYEKDKKIIL